MRSFGGLRDVCAVSGREPQFGKIGPGSKAQGEQIPRLVGPYKKATKIQRSCEQRAIRNQSISSLKGHMRKEGGSKLAKNNGVNGGCGAIWLHLLESYGYLGNGMYGHGAGSECAQYVLALHLQE